MVINSKLLKRFINVNADPKYLKELLASIGIEVDGISDYKGTTIYEVEITPNRPDWLSHYGIAREIYAKERELEFRPISFRGPNPVSSGTFKIAIDNKDDCARYSGAILRNVVVGDSDDSVKESLESLGLRPVNNLVDISNLILMLYGHPTHIFDLDKINGNGIRTRLGKQGESIKLLDGTVVKISDADLVIADSESPLALAGIMGGEISGVSSSTRDIVIESAWFNPSRIRRSARRLGLKTDSSYIFERGADIEAAAGIVSFVIDMIRDGQTEKIEITDVFDEYPGKSAEQKVVMEKDFPSRFTGIQIESTEYKEILENLGFGLTEKERSFEVSVPSFRVDINGTEDLVEEIIRIYGYDKLHSEVPTTINSGIFNDRKRTGSKKICSHLQSRGFTEVINYSFHSSASNKIFEDKENSILLKNPIGSDFSTLRNSLLPGLLRNTKLNLNNDFKGVHLMETGKIFKSEQNIISEKLVLGLSSCGETLPSNWRNSSGESADFFTFKSEIGLLLDSFRPGLDFSTKKSDKKFFEPGAGFSVLFNNTDLGFIGEVNSKLLAEFGINKELFFAELEFDKLLDIPDERSFSQWNRLPSSIRDLSFVVEKNIAYGDIESFIKRCSVKYLEDFSLVDVFEGDKIENNMKSMLMSFRFRGTDKTLKGDEISAIFGDLVDKMKSTFGISIR